MTIADSATVGGGTSLALGGQLSGGHRCHGPGGGFGLIAGLGRELGFFLRVYRR